MKLMNRVFKFRVYHTHFKEWMTDEEIWTYSNERRSLNELFDQGNNYNPKLLVFQQWTGLKDGSGKDIYEGDILFKKGYPEMEVEFNRGCFCARNPLNPEHCCCLRDLENLNTWKVIKTIFD